MPEILSEGRRRAYAVVLTVFRYLPPPVRRGRAALYDDSHVRRLDGLHDLRPVDARFERQQQATGDETANQPDEHEERRLHRKHHERREQSWSDEISPRVDAHHFERIDFLAVALLSGTLQAEAGDPARGQTLYESRCIGCHSLDSHRVGPAHRGVAGRRAGSARGAARPPTSGEGGGPRGAPAEPARRIVKRAVDELKLDAEAIAAA